MPSKHFTDQATPPTLVLSLQPRLFSSCDGSRVREQGRTSQQQKGKATVNRLLFCFETRSYPMAWADPDLDVWPMLTSAYLGLSNTRMQMGTTFPTKPHGPASSSLAVQDICARSSSLPHPEQPAPRLTVPPGGRRQPQNSCRAGTKTTLVLRQSTRRPTNSRRHGPLQVGDIATHQGRC